MNKYSTAVQRLCTDWDNEREEFKRRANAPDKHAKCKMQKTTDCGLKICCFECYKKVQCLHFQGVCNDKYESNFEECEQREF